MDFNNISTGHITWSQAATDMNENFGKVSTEIEKLKNATTRNKGFFNTAAELTSSFKSAAMGDFAYVGTSYPLTIYRYDGLSWVASEVVGGTPMLDSTSDTTDYNDVF